MNARIGKFIFPGLVGLACVLALFHWIYYYDQFIDDAYISFQVARNWADGLGWVYNPGERVEGFSNFLWTFLIGVGIRLGGDAQVLAKLFGLFSLIGTLIASAMLADFLLAPDGTGKKRARWTSLWATAVPLLLAFNTYLIYWSSLGLETALFTLLLVSSYGLYLREVQRDKFPFSAFLFILLCMTRPEGNYYLGLFLAARLTLWIGGGFRPGRRDALWLLIALAGAVTYAAWRIVYFGDYFPNTYYAKVSPHWLAFHDGGWRYLATFLFHHGILNAVLFPGALLAGLILHRRTTLLLLLPIATVCAYSYLVDGDWMGNYRFLVPAIPFLYLLTVVAGETLTTFAARRFGRRAATCVVALLVLTFLGHAIGNLRIRHDAAYIGGRESSRKDAGLFKPWAALNHGFHPVLRTLTEHLMVRAPAETVVLAPDIGFLGYTTRFHIIDSRGLTDKTVARLMYSRSLGQAAFQEAEQAFLESLRERRPEWLLLVYDPKIGGGNRPVEITLFGRPEFLDDYRLVEELDYYAGRQLRLYASSAWEEPLTPEERVERYRTAIRENPHVSFFYASLANLYLFMQQPDAAQEILRDLRRRYPALAQNQQPAPSER